jgi:hypothetical protein
MPSAGCTGTSHLICPWGHINIGQPEEWMERSMRVSRVERQGLALPGPRARTSPHPPHLRENGADTKTFLSAYYDDKGQRGDITNEDVSKALKAAATVLEYPTMKGIPIDRIDTHSLRSGGANALSLSGNSDTQIQKMGRWRGATFKEYIREELVCFSEGMSKSMKTKFDFVNIAGNTFNTITDDLIDRDYDVNVSAASAA